MTVLVLGGSGFIGGAIAQRIEGARAPTRRAVNLGDPKAIAEAAKGCSHVVHAAGIVSPRAAARALRWTNIAGIENVLNACRHANVKRLVYISCTDVTLGNVDRVHWDEKRPIAGKPFGERAQSLQLTEEIALSASTDALEVTVLRPAWVWGPGDTSRLPGLCAEALGGGIRLVGDGSNFLATTYIDHVVDAVESALEAEDAAGRVFHIADATFLAAREFFGGLSTALDIPPPKSTPTLAITWPVARLSGRGPGGLSAAELLQRGRSSLFDFNSAIGKLGYDPNVSMSDALAATAKWLKAEGGPAALAKRQRPPPTAESVDAQVEAAGGD